MKAPFMRGVCHGMIRSDGMSDVSDGLDRSDWLLQGEVRKSLQLCVLVMPMMCVETVGTILHIFSHVHQNDFCNGEDLPEILNYIISGSRAFYFVSVVIVIISCRDLFPDGIGYRFAGDVIREDIEIPAGSWIAIVTFRGPMEDDLAIVFVIIVERFSSIQENEEIFRIWFDAVFRGVCNV